MKSKLKLLAVALLAGGAMFAQPRVAIGVGVYGPGAYGPPAYAQYQPPCPGPGYMWVDGYWGPQGVWVGGFWRAPAIAVAPRYGGPVYRYAYRGYDRDYRGHYDRGRGYGYSHGFRR